VYKFVSDLQEELNNSSSLPIFEIEVVSSKTGEKDWISCDIYFKGNSICASRIRVSSKELKSKYVAYSRVVCDSFYSLDQHIESLYDQVLQDIDDGDLYLIGEQP